MGTSVRSGILGYFRESHYWRKVNIWQIGKAISGRDNVAKQFVIQAHSFDVTDN